MDIQTLKPIFLDYFWEQMRKEQEIKINSLVEMAQNVDTAAKTLNELVNEGFIEGIRITWGNVGPVFQSSHDAKLTQKGLKQVARKNAIEDFFPELANQEKVKEENKPSKKSLTAEDLIQNAEDTRITKVSLLSKEEKYSQIKKQILILFDKLKNSNLEFVDEKITPYSLQVKINKIAKYYYKDYRPVIARIISSLGTKGFINYRYGDRNPNLDFKNLITDKGIQELEEKYFYCYNKPLGKMTDEELQATFGDVVPNLSKALSNMAFCGTIPKIAKLNLTSAIPVASEIISASRGILKSTQNLASLEGLTKAVIETQNLHGDKSSNNSKNTPNKKDKNTFTFDGILGKNCGTVVEPTGADEKRIQEKGFKVEEGIMVLRGFARSSDLARFSQPDQNYQRDKKPEHLKHLKEFMKSMKTSAKYIPEVTLVARGYENLEPIKISGSLTPKQKGELDNLEYWQLTVNQNQLYRIDGNHRLLATENDDYYVPFSIIVWDESNVNQDDEAFLFYFLNSKAKKLTTEENLKGLVDAQSWEDHELEKANVLLPYIRHFRKNFENHKLFNKTFYKDSQNNENAKTQILKILEIILKEENSTGLSFDINKFEEHIKDTQEILSQKDRFKYLRDNFRCFPQLVFYTLYKNEDYEKAIQFLTETDNWAEYFLHDSNSFIYPDKMYNNAKKQLNKKVKIFVAMPYYDDDTVKQFNKTFKSLVEELKKENDYLKDRLELCPIMTYKAESTDILSKMDIEIGSCDIFIADISKYKNFKVNPNVMYELGRVVGKTPFILIRNKDNKPTDIAFDIAHWSYEKINFGVAFDTSLKGLLKPKILEITKKQIGLC